MRMALRFLIPLILILALGGLAWVAAPLLGDPIERWSRADLEIRSQLVFDSIQETVVRAARGADGARIDALFQRIAQDERLLALGLCTPDGRLAHGSAAWPANLGCPQGPVRGSGTAPVFRVRPPGGSPGTCWSPRRSRWPCFTAWPPSCKRPPERWRGRRPGNWVQATGSRPVKDIFEILPVGYGKGSAIRRFMDRPPYAGRTPVFAGDDLTDEDGFAAVDALGGISVGVGERAVTRAGHGLDSPGATRALLGDMAASWASATPCLAAT